MAPTICTPAEAARLIPDGGSVLVCGCLSMLEPDATLAGIEARFLAEGRPRDLTVIHPVMVGSRKGAGINRLAHDGLMRRVIGGSFSIFADYEITGMIKQDRVEAFNLPIGTPLPLAARERGRPAGPLHRGGAADLRRPAGRRGPGERGRHGRAVRGRAGGGAGVAVLPEPRRGRGDHPGHLGRPRTGTSRSSTSRRRSGSTRWPWRRSAPGGGSSPRSSGAWRRGASTPA